MPQGRSLTIFVTNDHAPGALALTIFVTNDHAPGALALTIFVTNDHAPGALALTIFVTNDHAPGALALTYRLFVPFKQIPGVVIHLKFFKQQQIFVSESVFFMVFRLI
jgi:hypothetical protein